MSRATHLVVPVLHVAAPAAARRARPSRGWHDDARAGRAAPLGGDRPRRPGRSCRGRAPVGGGARRHRRRGRSTLDCRRAPARRREAGRRPTGRSGGSRPPSWLAMAGKDQARGWVDESGGVRASRIGRYVAHDDLGAELLAVAAARPEAVAWAGAHHRPDRWSGTGIPLDVCRALAGPTVSPPAAVHGAESGAPRPADRWGVPYKPEAPVLRAPRRARPSVAVDAHRARRRLGRTGAPSRYPRRRRKRKLHDPPGVDRGAGRAVRLARLGVHDAGRSVGADPSWIDNTRSDLAHRERRTPTSTRTASYFDSLYASAGQLSRHVRLRGAGRRPASDRASMNSSGAARVRSCSRAASAGRLAEPAAARRQGSGRRASARRAARRTSAEPSPWKIAEVVTVAAELSRRRRRSSPAAFDARASTGIGDARRGVGADREQTVDLGADRRRARRYRSCTGRRYSTTASATAILKRAVAAVAELLLDVGDRARRSTAAWISMRFETPGLASRSWRTSCRSR